MAASVLRALLAGAGVGGGCCCWLVGLGGGRGVVGDTSLSVVGRSAGRGGGCPASLEAFPVLAFSLLKRVGDHVCRLGKHAHDQGRSGVSG